MSLGKRFTLPKVPLLGENAGLELKANAYNLFNKINLAPFGFNSASTNLGSFSVVNGVDTFQPSATFGQAQGALSGRVVELLARFDF